MDEHSIRDAHIEEAERLMAGASYEKARRQVAEALAAAEDRIYELERKALVRSAGCAWGDEACRFVRERDAALQALRSIATKDKPVSVLGRPYAKELYNLIETAELALASVEADEEDEDDE